MNAFRPSLCTPLLFAPVTLFPNWNKKGGVTFMDNRTLRGVYSFCEGPWSHLCTVVIERATDSTSKLFHTICMSPKLKSARDSLKIKMLQNNFDLSPYLREYPVDEEKYPGWFLESYTPHDRLKKIYLWTKERENKKFVDRKFV